MFIGRGAELQFLEDKYQSPGGQLVVLYGRRRVGKTETLRRFCQNKRHVFFSCRECTDKLQLSAFSEKMMREDIPARQYRNEFADWEQAFRSAAELPGGADGTGKSLLVIDEFPYMCKGNADIPSILQNVWDEHLKDAEVMIILCGSAMSFIEKDLLAEKNPLYGRATGIYKMKPMGFYDAVQFFPGYSDTDKVLAYAVLGGIPHYLRQFNPELSLADNIKKNILTRGCVLYSEPEFLLRQELRETPLYNALIAAVALGGTKLNEISQKSLVEDTAKASVYLKNLNELGIVEREFSIDTGTKEKANAHRGFYRLADNFFRFWYAFVFTHYSELESGDADGVYQYAIAPELHKFASLAFEDVCREYVRVLQKIGALPFRFSDMGRWFGKTTIRNADASGKTTVAETKLDLVAVSPGFKDYLIGECKFKGTPFSYGEYLDATAKLAPQQEKAAFYHALFSRSGFDDKLTEEAAANPRLALYSLAEIVGGTRNGKS